MSPLLNNINTTNKDNPAQPDIKNVISNPNFSQMIQMLNYRWLFGIDYEIIKLLDLKISIFNGYELFVRTKLKQLIKDLTFYDKLLSIHSLFLFNTDTTKEIQEPIKCPQ